VNKRSNVLWSRGHATSSVTTVLPPPGQRRLPEQLWQLDITFGQFKQSLKTFTFG